IAAYEGCCVSSNTLSKMLAVTQRLGRPCLRRLLCFEYRRMNACGQFFMLGVSDNAQSRKCIRQF
ncbi:hypothetical protein R0J87_24340, partial [Halomonas sp. SIMBA_159]